MIARKSYAGPSPFSPSTLSSKTSTATGLTTSHGWCLYIIIVLTCITSHIQTVQSFVGIKNTSHKEVELAEYLPNGHVGCTSFQRAHDLDSVHSGGSRSGDEILIDVENLVLDKTFGCPIMKLDEGSPPFNAVVSSHNQIDRERTASESDKASQPNSKPTYNISKGPRAKNRNCFSNCYAFLPGRNERQETQKALSEPLLRDPMKELHPSFFQDPVKNSEIVVPHCLYHSGDGESLDWEKACWRSFGKSLETYINGDRKERERESLSILHYTRRLSFNGSQIDELLHIFDQLLKAGELSLFDKAHLSFSLHSFGSVYCKGISQEDHEKIYRLAQLLEQHCRSDPESLVAVWNGSVSEDEEVIRDLLDPMLSLTQANFDDVVKGASLRSSWLHGIITSGGIYATERAFRDAEPKYIKTTLNRIRDALGGRTVWSDLVQPTSWDFLYLMKSLYILQVVVEQKTKSLNEHRTEGCSYQTQNEWASILSVLMECKDLILKPELLMPPKNLEMKRAYSEIIKSQVQEEGLNKYGWGEGSQNVFLRMAGHKQLIPETGTTQGMRILMQSMSKITKPKTLIQSIQGLGKDASVITEITKNDDHFYHNKILRLLQWLSMKYYVDDEVDFLIKKQIINKAIEVHRETASSESRDLVFALVGRLLILHPTDQELLKLAKFDDFRNSLEIRRLSSNYTPPESSYKMPAPIKLVIWVWKFLHED